MLCAKNSVTLNPKKFKFAQRKVDFCGFTIGWDSYHPSADTISAIRSFPMPSQPTITDIRSWFGLVNQIAPFLASSSMMAPFRELLKSSNLNGKKVYWDAELKKTFENTKTALCEVASNGLTYWSSWGLGLCYYRSIVIARGR